MQQQRVGEQYQPTRLHPRSPTQVHYPEKKAEQQMQPLHHCHLRHPQQGQQPRWKLLTLLLLVPLAFGCCRC
jgi:hypothetical protein